MKKLPASVIAKLNRYLDVNESWAWESFAGECVYYGLDPEEVIASIR
jgi:hypothetical protein